MIKKISLISILSIYAFGFDYNLNPQKIGNDTWCFIGKTEVPSKENGGFMSNSCYVKTKDSYVVIDSGVGYDFAEQSYKAMQKIANLPVKNIIITHSHDDHWLGNNFYKEKFSSNIYGPKSINTEYNENSEIRGLNFLSDEDQKRTKFVKIDKEINDEITLNIENKTFKIIALKEKAHTNSDLLIYLEEDKTLFVGDIIMNDRITSNRDGSIIGTLKALDKIKSYKWNYIVAGHGNNTSKTALEHTENYFSLLKSRVMDAIEDGTTADEISKVVTMDDFKDVAMFDELNSRNVFDAFRELEFYEED